MSTNNPVGFLSNNPAEQAKLPVGGGDFAPSGFIGKTRAQVLYSFMSQEDSQTGQYEGLPPYVGRRAAGSWFVYYYDDPDKAKAVMGALGVEGFTNNKGKTQDPAAQQVWSFQIARGSVLNFADQAKLDKWSDPIALDCRIATLGSRKYRHELHLLALPIAVQAMAKLQGYSYEPFSVSELLKKPEEMQYTDEFFAEMCGRPDAKKGEQGYFTDSVLWQRRAALWASLGEANAEAYLPLGSEKYGTTSAQLSSCLTVLASKWTATPYARVITIPDPRVDALKDDKRFTIPALYEVFPTEQAAREAAALDLERMSKHKDNANGAQGTLALPEAWKELPTEWNAKVASLKGKSYSVPQLVKLAKENAVTADELKAWLV